MGMISQGYLVTHCNALTSIGTFTEPTTDSMAKMLTPHTILSFILYLKPPGNIHALDLVGLEIRIGLPRLLFVSLRVTAGLNYEFRLLITPNNNTIILIKSFYTSI